MFYAMFDTMSYTNFVTTQAANSLNALGLSHAQPAAI